MKGNLFNEDTRRLNQIPCLGQISEGTALFVYWPSVEGLFNIMDDIIKKDRARLNLETYEGFAVIKTHLKAAEQTASMMRISAAMRSLCLSSFDRYKS